MPTDARFQVSRTRSGSPKGGSSSATADAHSLQWLNMFVSSIWPHADSAVRKFLQDELLPKLREMPQMPTILRNLQFSQCKLGDNSPEFGPITVAHFTDMNGVESVEVELDVRYAGDVHFKLEAGGMSMGVSKIHLKAHLCCIFKPLMDVRPVIGAMQLFFTNSPSFDFNLEGLGDFPGFADLLKNYIINLLENSMVLPNRKVEYLTQNEEHVDLSEAASTKPLGIIRILPARAHSLPGAKWKFGEGLYQSDPYCSVRVGCERKRTETQTDTTSPIWERKSENTLDFIVHDLDQFVTLSFHNQQQGMLPFNFLSFLGKTKELRVRDLLALAPVKGNHEFVRQSWIPIDVSEVNTEMMHSDDPVLNGATPEIEIEAQWYTLENKPKAFSRSLKIGSPDGGPACVFFVRIHRGNYFPAELLMQDHNIRLTIEVEGEKKLTKPAKRSLPPDMGEGIVLGIPQHYVHVVNNLLERRIPVKEIASIIQVDEKAVLHYISIAEEYHARLLKVTQTNQEFTSYHWHDVIGFTLRKPKDATVVVTLLIDGTSMGSFKVGLKKLMDAQDCQIPRTEYTFTPPEPKNAFSSWLFPTCATNLQTDPRWSAMNVEMTLELHAGVPCDVGQNLMLAKTRADQERALFGVREPDASAYMTPEQKLAAVFSNPHLSQTMDSWNQNGGTPHDSRGTPKATHNASPWTGTASASASQQFPPSPSSSPTTDRHHLLSNHLYPNPSSSTVGSYPCVAPTSPDDRNVINYQGSSRDVQGSSSPTRATPVSPIRASLGALATAFQSFNLPSSPTNGRLNSNVVDGSQGQEKLDPRR